MSKTSASFRARLMGGAAAAVLMISAGSAAAQEIAKFDIAPQPLADALKQFGYQSGHGVLASPALADAKVSHGVAGEQDVEIALNQLLDGSGLTWKRNGDTFLIVSASDPQSGSAAGDGADSGTVQALIVTAQKREENIQDVPIAMSAFTQEALERSQVAGGPDLMTQVPNMTFTKTNFSSYSIQIRGIGTQAISATTDAAVAVAFNNTPFIRNRFFEQEFYDLQRVEVLRGPQGTLYGRNATAGVVNLISQKPKFTYEAKASLDVSNYNSHRLEGMLNIPLVEDKVALRIAGAWTKRDGYDTNQITGNQIDGRDLWSTRLSLRVTPTDKIDVNLIWEHFQEKDDRLRSGKQLCHQDDRSTLGPLAIQAPGVNGNGGGLGALYSNVYSQGCLPASLYSPDSYEAPNGYSLPYFNPFAAFYLPFTPNFNPYASLVQSPDLRVIESTIDPDYRAKTDLVELQWNADISDALTVTSETSYLYDTIFSKQDYNRFNTASGAFSIEAGNTWARPPSDYLEPGASGAVFCDPQVGCADRLVAVDVSRAKSSQFSQEFRVSSNHEGPFNFSLGANFLRYDTEEKYYVFINTLTMFAVGGGAYNPLTQLPHWQPGVSDNHECLPFGQVRPNPAVIQTLIGCPYIDPNPIESVNDLGHNYFLSKNPYKLISYAVFGEAYYNITDNLKLTAGLRWTVDKKEAPRIPSMLLSANTVGLTTLTVEEQEWREPTGRLAIDWKPDLAFTDQTLLYASYAHGYKAGGSNPPPSSVEAWTPEVANIILQDSVAKPKTFDPEFVDAFEIGAKNTLLDGKMTLNLAAFYYDYKGYQVSQIIDRSAVNYNFDSKVWGLEVEADWRPLENLRLGFKGGYENTRIADGEQAIDIMERNYGHGPDSADPWVVIRPFPTFPSNCVLPLYLFDQGLGTGQTNMRYPMYGGGNMGPCEMAYAFGVDPVTFLPYVANPTLTQGIFGGTQPIDMPGNGSLTYVNYPGFNPLDESLGNNHGEGFFKPLGGHELPNAPHFTATVTADYTIPLPSNWLMTLHTDLYYQSEAWTRVFNMPGYDKLKAYTNVNLAAIFTNEDVGWKVMAYVKNVFDRDSITGSFLNSDDTGLTTNVFLTEPRLYGLRVTKDFSGGPWWTGADPTHTGPYPLTIELSGQVQRQDAPYDTVGPAFISLFSSAVTPANTQHQDLDWGDGREVRVTYRPSSGPWSLIGAARYGRANKNTPLTHASEAAGPLKCAFLPDGPYGAACDPDGPSAYALLKPGTHWSDSSADEKERHVIADFAIGRDVGLGALGDSHSILSGGIRYAEFDSTTRATMDGVPTAILPDGFIKYPSVIDHYRAAVTADRKFKGAGPTLSWDAAQRLVGDERNGHLDVDWAITAGVLFGKQRMTADGTQQERNFREKYQPFIADAEHVGGTAFPMTDVAFDAKARSKDVTAPVLDLSLGLAYEVGRFKAGAGYRWERYFNVLDVGYDEQKDGDRTMDGPYFKIAVGFGG
jgi:outer membrane receptor protein involved in Fe transport